jgi:hypothetical protein
LQFCHAIAELLGSRGQFAIDCRRSLNFPAVYQIAYGELLRIAIETGLRASRSLALLLSLFQSKEKATKRKIGADGRSRTGTGLPLTDFKSVASTNSATPAGVSTNIHGCA